MHYYANQQSKTRTNAEIAPVDPEANRLFEEAKGRYQSALLDAYMAGNYAEFAKVKERVAEQCREESNKVAPRYKPLKILPVLLLDYLEEELYQ